MSTSLLQPLQYKIVFAACWLCWATLQMVVLQQYGFDSATAAWDSVINNLLLAGVSVLVTVTLQFYIPQKNRWGYILALCSILTLVWLLASRSLSLFVLKDIDGYSAFFSLSIPVRLAISFLIIAGVALLSVLWYTVQEQREIERRKTDAEKLSREAELYNLRQQLQPHFLFNSLNSINALIGLQPQQARTMVQQLSDFLRGTLRKDDHQWTSLEEELLHLQLYLDIEKVRFGHRLSTTVNNEPATNTMRLPVMLLQPLVENAIKFGVYDTVGDICITIDAINENGDLLVCICNPFDPQTSSQKTGTGFGLNSVRRRLYLLFARSDLLQTKVKKQLFITTLKIPQPK